MEFDPVRSVAVVFAISLCFPASYIFRQQIQVCIVKAAFSPFKYCRLCFCMYTIIFFGMHLRIDRASITSFIFHSYYLK